MTASARSAVVTGGGSGIGRAVALALQGAGYDVVIAGRRARSWRDGGQAAADGGRMLPVPTDVADAGIGGGAVRGRRARFGRLDVLFNNAGMSASRGAVR